MSRVAAWTALNDIELNDQGIGCVSAGVAYLADTADSSHLYRKVANAFAITGYTGGGPETVGIIGRADGKVVGFDTDGVGFVYDPDTDVDDGGGNVTAWPRPRRYAIPVPVGSLLYMIGGDDPDNPGNPCLLADVCDVEADTWTELLDLDYPTWKGAGCERLGKILAWGRDDPNGVVARRYDPVTPAWTDIGTGAPFADFEEGIAAALEDAGLVLLHAGFGDTAFSFFDAATDTYTESPTALPGFLGDDITGSVSVNGVPYVFPYSGPATGLARFRLVALESDVPFLLGNDRYQTVDCVAAGTSPGDGTAPEFRYWYAGPPPWAEALSGTGDIPPFFALDENDSPVDGRFESREFMAKDETLVGIVAIVVDFVPRPFALGDADGGLDDAAVLSFSGQIEGYGRVDLTDTDTDDLETGTVVSAAFSWSGLAGAQASGRWPNQRTVKLPCVLTQHVRRWRVMIDSQHHVEVRSYHVLGIPFPQERQ